MRPDKVAELAVTEKGAQTAALILEQARNILSERGFHALSIRNIAKRCDITPGNVSYYFKTKDELMEHLARHIFDRWSRRFYARVPSHIDNEIKFFVYSIESMIEENKRPRTGLVLQEMWALSNHNPSVMRMMDVFYGQMRSWIEGMLLGVNPSQRPSLRSQRAALITAQIEGLMLLIGHKRPPHAELKGLEGEAVTQITRIALGR
jgi:AcrR family transcriptional regulator